MKTIKRFKWWIISGISTLLLLAFFFAPLPYYIETPGGAYDVRSVISVNDKEDKEKGSYNFVAVKVGRATPAQVVYAWLTPFTEVSSAQETTGGISDADYMRINQFYMETSQNGAVQEALKLAGKKSSLKYKGVYVLNVNKNSSFKGVLNIADTVTGVNGKTFSSSKELIKSVSSLKVGSQVTVQYISEGQKKSAKGKIIKLSNGKNGIGIGLVDHTKVVSDDKIKFSVDGVGGPSAGLMFTLDIYDQLVKDDLRKGRVIAGTGSIGENGAVGDIGGVSMKVASADKIHADIFFVPNNPVDKAVLKENPKALNNYEEAKKAAKQLGTKMKIVPVKNVKEAVQYLKKTKN
ncbi:SepM family pheromone-processing serine protease [Streptococcus macacae]|uniref:Lon protease S16 C-terminal proteolytic domain protein n=1 Tax=Streptococcus macacae NCTC 11558 TaxID=764298 RepID=G5JWQ6_9STRE|nr:SepM family pheromone-processing serine protease [Streptococcus macacae]EHJ52127.1 lon protease S16 C-terminal proteolytic domain protein [Streptococcus macacae NCTC 11558]SUN79016.1 ATP-dependent endopeptidase [Streptococcus macacae NCTC 11558]